MHSHMEVVTENMVAGTSAKVFLQFWNCYVKKRFLSYDYGPRANLRIYGSVPARPRPTGQLSSGASACPPPAHLLVRAQACCSRPARALYPPHFSLTRRTRPAARRRPSTTWPTTT